MSKPKTYENIVGFKCNDEMLDFLKKRTARKSSFMSQVIRELILDEMYRLEGVK